MDRLKENLWKALDKIDSKEELSHGDLELAHKLTDTIKNIDKIYALEEGVGYSEAVDNGDYGRGASYANRGKHYVRGHYSRAGWILHAPGQSGPLQPGRWPQCDDGASGNGSGFRQ